MVSEHTDEISGQLLDPVKPGSQVHDQVNRLVFPNQVKKNRNQVKRDWLHEKECRKEKHKKNQRALIFQVCNTQPES